MTPNKRQKTRLAAFKADAVRAATKHRAYQDKLVAACTHEDVVVLSAGPEPFCRCQFCGRYKGTGAWRNEPDECPHPKGYHRVAGQAHHGYGKYIDVRVCGVCSMYSLWGTRWCKEYPVFRHDD